MDNQAASEGGRTVDSGCLSVTPPRIRAIVGRLSLQPKTFHLAVTAGGMLAIAALDALVHPDYSFLDFYLIPIVYALWFLGTDYALAFSCAGLAIPAAPRHWNITVTVFAATPSTLRAIGTSPFPARLRGTLKFT
jgi:hypothetical protein